jgi:hypothetical protein
MPASIHVSLSRAGVLIYSASHLYNPENALLLAILYTALLVSVLFSKAYRGGSGQRNAVPIWKIIRVHTVFLAILLGLIWLASRFAPLLPDWMTENSRPMGHPDSPFDFLFFGAGFGLHLLERLWLYAQSRRFNPSTPEDVGSGPEAGDPGPDELSRPR